jgi:hypothetical protein
MAKERCNACGQRIGSGNGPPICDSCYPGYAHAIELAAGICQTYAAGAAGSKIDNPTSRLSTASFLEGQIRRLDPENALK